MAGPSRTADAHALTAAVRVEQVRGHAASLGFASLGSFAAALVSAWALQGAIEPQRLSGWLALLAAMLAVRWLLTRPLRRPGEIGEAEAARWAIRLRGLAALHGLTWGSLALLAPAPLALPTLATLVVVHGGMAFSVMTVALHDGVAAAAFVVPELAPLAWRVASEAAPLPRLAAVAALIVLLLAAALWAAARVARDGRRRLALARRVDDERARRVAEAEVRLRQVFDHIGEGLCLFDAGQRLVAWNPRIVELAGIDPGQVRAGTPLRALLSSMAQRGGFDGAAEAAGRRAAALARGGPRRMLLVRPGGSAVEFRRSPMPDGGFAVVGIDVTERRASERALADNRAKLRLLLEQTDEGVWFVDRNQVTTDANPAMCRLLGVEREALVGHSVYEFVDAANAAILREQFERRKAGQADGYEVTLRRSDGTPVYCQNNPAPILDAAGAMVGAIGLFDDISAHKRAAAELERASALLAAKSRLLESTLESLSQGVLNIGADGRIEAWNRRFVELTGVPEALLHDAATLRSVVAWQIGHGGMLPPGEGASGAWADEAQRYADGDDAWFWGTPRYQRQRADGTVLEVQMHAAPGGAQVRTYTDVTASVHAQRALRASESRFRAMADAAPALIRQCDRQGRPVWFNQGWLRVFGGATAEAASASWPACIHADDAERAVAAFERAARDGEAFEIEYRVRAAGGGLWWIADHGVAQVDEAGERDGCVVYGWNITQRRSAQQALVVARDEAERANRAKSEFLSRMSHELRTPLNAVLGFAQLIESDPGEPLQRLQRERIRQIRAGGEHLLGLINEVLDLSRIESGSLALRAQPVAAQAVLRACMRLVEPMARAQGVVLDTQGPLDALGLVHCDATRLRQVLLNLLSNAIKYNRSPGRVGIVVSSGASKIRIEVSDTGPGLTREQQQRLFQTFERLDADRSAIEGTGIGLALSKALVELMGGRIGVRSQPGHGSTFWIELPRGEPSTLPAPAEPRAAGPSPARAGAAGAVRRVLCIEDNVVNQAIIETMLARLPRLSVTTAAEPGQGLALALAHPPDLVLLDIQLPQMSGYEVLTRLRGYAATARVPVVAVSANAMPDDLERARAAGFDDYVTKPLDMQRLLRTVEGLLPSA